MKFAVYTVSLPEYNLAESVALLKEMGYDGVEWRVDSSAGIPRSMFPADLDEYAFRYWLDNKSTLIVDRLMEDCQEAKALCDEAGLEIVNLAPGQKAEVAAQEPLLAAAASIGCKSIRGPMVRYNPAKPYREQFDAYRSFLKDCEPLLKQYGVKMLIETHHGNLVTSASSAMRVLDGFDPAYYGVIYDCGNMVNEGYEDYPLALEMLGEYLAHVHLKNAALIPGKEDSFGALHYNRTWMPLKKGSADLLALMKALVKVGYDGVISVEDFSNEKPTREKLEENIQYLRQLLTEAQV